MNIGYFLTLLGLAQLILGFWFILGYRGNQTSLWYGFFMIGVALYVSANGIGYLDWMLSQETAEHLAWAGGAITATFILPFSFSFPYPKKRVRELLPLIVWPILIFVPGILWKSIFIIQQAQINFKNGYLTQTGAYFPFFLIFFVTYWLWAFVNFTLSLRTSDGVHRRYLSIFLIGTIVSIVISGYFDIYLPLTKTTHFGYVGSLCSVVWFGFTSYILVKK